MPSGVPDMIEKERPCRGKARARSIIRALRFRASRRRKKNKKERLAACRVGRRLRGMSTVEVRALAADGAEQAGGRLVPREARFAWIPRKEEAAAAGADVIVQDFNGRARRSSRASCRKCRYNAQKRRDPQRFLRISGARGQ